MLLDKRIKAISEQDLAKLGVAFVCTKYRICEHK